MNRIYRVIWSKVRGTWIVASELATGRSKGASDSGAKRAMAGCHRLLPPVLPLRMAVLGALGNGIAMAAGTSLSSTTTLGGRTVTLNAGLVTLHGASGSARLTGAGGLDVIGNGVSLTDDTNDYRGQTRFRTHGSRSFTSIADLGVASSRCQQSSEGERDGVRGNFGFRMTF